jgi:hypothetical protein
LRRKAVRAESAQLKRQLFTLRALTDAAAESTS